MNSLNKVLWGLILIVIGIVIGLNSFGITDINLFFEGWWTLFIIIPCTIDLFSDKTGKVGNLIGIIIGVALLLITRDIIDLALIAKLIIPIIFVLIGLSLIFNSTIKKNIADKVREGSISGLEPIVATFSKQEAIKEDENFKGAALEAVFGTVVFDLRKANIEKEAVIKANAIFGSIEILIPKNTEVKIKSTPIFGSVSNNTAKTKGEKKTIYVEAFAMFGGVDIK
ncbi:MAG: hypothetical protein J6A52_07725 [Bacilli bacterium]|nr:hypothetical protein [Bacilli bacterium]